MQRNHLERQRAAHYDELCAALRAVAAISASVDGWVRVTDWRWNLTPLSPAGSLKEIGGVSQAKPLRRLPRHGHSLELEESVVLGARLRAECFPDQARRITLANTYPSEPLKSGLEGAFLCGE
jgi:hypothetical protein